MRVLNQIAQLILEDPYITAVQIARRLGYAEEKTVYYWIDKGHYQGLTAFKRAVLAGQYHINATAREPRVRYGKVPIVYTFTPEGNPVHSGESVSVANTHKAQLAWRYQGLPLPTILAQDILLAASLDDAPQAPLRIVLTAEGAVELRHRIVADDRDLLVHPLTLAVDPSSRPLYAVVQLIRTF